MTKLWIYPAFFLLFTVFLFLYLRRRLAICRINTMPVPEKLELLNKAAAPLGFEYRLSQDIFASRTDAWQRNAGYCALYDSRAPFFHMVFDCEPIYFNYGEKTWLIELWKGQYGITAGCEIGIYKADRILDKSERSKSLFHTVSDGEFPVFSFTLFRENVPVFHICREHWWLAAFRTGLFSCPEMLCMKVSVSFPSIEMCHAFIHGLCSAGYYSKEICSSGRTVSFSFGTPHYKQPALRRSGYTSWVQLKNRTLINIFFFATKPFCFTMDRVLFLLEFMPPLFRRLLAFARTRYHVRRYRHER